MKQIKSVFVVLLALAGSCLLVVDTRAANLDVDEGTMEAPYEIDWEVDLADGYFRPGRNLPGVASIEQGGAVYGGMTFIANGSAGTGGLLINGGTLNKADAPFLVRIGSGGNGTMIINSGTAYASDLEMGYSTSWSELTVNGGTLNISGGNFGIRMGVLSGGSIGGGIIRQTGGTINVTSKDARIGYAGGTQPCTLEIAGGTYNQTSGGMYVGTASSSGTLHIKGSGATTIDVSRFYTYADYTTFLFTLDAGGVDVVNVNYAYTTTLAGTLDMETTVSVSAGAYFDLMTTTGTGITSNLALAAGDGEFWDLSVVDGKTLRATCVKAIEIPEPATMALLGVGAASVFLGRRRRHG
ncbi:MAG: PEP-CTERM sorting domain-containing protein [Phycisphaerae bacterium]|nr:PEP-CTERM sorting domain-containing protein [Phycisphaerae bacterium]